ncbi:MAG: hypothetical protein KF832_19010 [Caldilineaceae bacterium]|nr:hypothetical protein [Caldilineaceae bacterium]
MNSRTILYGALAGALGGAVGWLPAELLALPEPTQELAKYGLLALYFALVSTCIGAAIGAVDGILHGRKENAIAGARTGALLGAVGGAVGSLPGEAAFQGLSALGLGLVGRALGWAVVGIFIGLAQGVTGRDQVRLLRGGLGGLIGGYLGGGAFELINSWLASGTGSRWLALVILGAFLGAFIAFFQRWLSDAWLVVVSSGAQEGHRLDLTKPATVLGRGDRDDFVLYAGEGVAPRHALVVERANGYWLQAASPQHRVRLNGEPLQTEQRLRPHAEIGLGSMILRFGEKTLQCPQCNRENAARAQFCLGCGRGLATK